MNSADLQENIDCISQLGISGDFLKGTHEVLTIKERYRASLVVQWLRICLLMQGTRVRALVWEDPTCRGAAGPVSHNC